MRSDLDSFVQGMAIGVCLAVLVFSLVFGFSLWVIAAEAVLLAFLIWAEVR